jgi:hypothetical protein
LTCPDNDTGAIIPVLSSLLSSRDMSLVTNTVTTVIDAARELIAANSAHITCDLPATADELWQCRLGSVGSGLTAILASKSASLLFAKLLVSDLKDGSSMEHNVPVFYAKCLWILCDTHACPEMADIIRRLDITSLAEGAELRVLMEEVLGAVS